MISLKDMQQNKVNWVIMKEISKIIRDMEKEYIHHIVDLFMMENGIKII